MEIGIHGQPTPAMAWYLRDLGASWVKWAATVDGPEVTDDRAAHDYAGQLGLRVVVDLRTTSEWLTSGGTEAWNKLLADGRLQRLGERPEPPPQGNLTAEAYAAVLDKIEADRFAREDPVIRANQAATHAEVLKVLAARVQRHVALHQDRCQDWEWWGEWDCPVTSAGIFHILCYPETLRTVYRAIKEVQPTARVWTGGNGMDINDGWVVGLQRDGALRSFDVLNWHPYPMALRCRAKIEDKLHGTYDRWRQVLDTEGTGQPFASTEWGYPSLRAVTRQQREWLTSRVVEGGISQLYPEEALAAYAGDLRVMEQHGFEVVIVHALRDGPGRSWGEKCGLLEQPLKGLRGRALRAVWRTVEAKPIYRLVREWAHRGRAGRPAFTKET